MLRVKAWGFEIEGSGRGAFRMYFMGILVC